MSKKASWAMMVLAHNEESCIAACLDSLFDGEPSARLDVYVMANGCTDRTEEVVVRYARRRPEVHLVSIRLGDKCNAWNVFIHETVVSLCPDRDVYFFMDGDARIAPGSLTALAEALSSNPKAHAASAVPGSGRCMRADRDAILNDRGLVANLYALRPSFVRRLQTSGVRLPLNFEGDDGLLGALIKWDLDPRQEWDHALIEPCADAVFLFDAVKVTDLREWPKYWKRLVRYGRRDYEFQLIGPLLREKGVEGMPADVRTIYGGAERLRYKWRGIYTIPFALALRQMRRIGRATATVTRGTVRSETS